MLTTGARPGVKERRSGQDRERSVSPGSPPVCERLGALSDARIPLTVVLSGILFVLLASPSFAANESGPAARSPRMLLADPIRTVGVHPAHGGVQTADLRSLIGQIRFNRNAVSFDSAVTVGPGGGKLEIQFNAPPSGVADRLLYRLIGFDSEWKEAGKDRAILYDHLAPGRYEFDFQQADNTGQRASLVESIPITITAPFWQTDRFQTLVILFLLLLILVLYKLRVGYLKKKNHKLQEAVSQTKAELTLTAKIAGDAQEALKEQALKDSLTGLWNRRAIFAMLERETYRAQRDRFPITLVMIDLDHFKNINDSYGHLTGDEVLRETAGRLVEAMRPYDFAGRYGGEEFLVVLPSCSPQNGLQRAEHFRRAIAAKPVPTAIGPLAVTCSVGVAAYEENMPPEDLVHRADEALYRAKRLGRNCVCAGSSA
jgi:diguanylate cyclase (GGDEF)-like protein